MEPLGLYDRCSWGTDEVTNQTSAERDAFEIELAVEFYFLVMRIYHAAVSVVSVVPFAVEHSERRKSSNWAGPITIVGDQLIESPVGNIMNVW